MFSYCNVWKSFTAVRTEQQCRSEHKMHSAVIIEDVQLLQSTEEGQCYRNGSAERRKFNCRNQHKMCKAVRTFCCYSQPEATMLSDHTTPSCCTSQKLSSALRTEDVQLLHLTTGTHDTVAHSVLKNLDGQCSAEQCVIAETSLVYPGGSRCSRYR